MDFSNDPGNIPDNTIIDQPTAEMSASNHPCEEVVVVKESGKVILVHHPAGKTVTIGRSRKNNICLRATHIPRNAVEIVLGPVPVLRKLGDLGNSPSGVVPFPSKKPVMMDPYSIELLRYGEVVFNPASRRKSGRKRKNFFIFSLTVMFFSAIGLYTFRPWAASTILKKQPLGTSTEMTDIIVQEIPAEKTMDLTTKKIPPATTLKTIETPNQGRKKITPHYPDYEKTGNPKSLFTEKAKGIDSERFEEILQGALDSLKSGNPKQAGRSIVPLLLFLNQEQESTLVISLDPCLETIFQRAYMLRPYDRNASNEILTHIVASRLDILPTYQKAKELLETDRRSEPALRTIENPASTLKKVHPQEP